MRTNLCHYAVSICSCFLAMLIALVANTVIGTSSTLYLKMAEMHRGEVDVILTPSQTFTNYSRFLNSTRIDRLTIPKGILMTPRMDFVHTTIRKSGNGSRAVNLALMAINSTRERELSIGRKWRVRKLREGECAIHSSVAKELKLRINGTAHLSLHFDEYFNLLQTIYRNRRKNDASLPCSSRLLESAEPSSPAPWLELEPSGSRALTLMKGAVNVTCKVAAIFSSLGGKVQIGHDSEFVIMELDSFLRHLGRQLRRKDPGFAKFLARFPATDIATSVMTNHPHRLEVYKDNDYDTVKAIMTKYTSRLLDTLGFYPATTYVRILEDFIELSMGGVFLKIVLNLVVIILALISCFLIYTMLMMYAETKAFDIGIFRTLGMNKWGIVFLVLFHTFAFVVPAFLLAIVASFPTLSVVTNFLENSLDFAVSSTPNAASMLWALGIGVAIPVIASIFPIRFMFHQKVSASLDTSKARTQGMHVSVEHDDGTSSFTRMFPLGLIMIAFGLCIHYFVPLCLLST